jgi:Protein of unknown function (DUF4232)
MRKRAVQFALLIAAGVAVFALPAVATSQTGGPPRIGGPPPVGVPACTASELTASYAKVPGSNATGHVEYTLSVTNRSAPASCTLTARLPMTLLGQKGQKLPTEPSYATGGASSIILARGQFAQSVSQFSPDFASGGEPTHGNCEPVAHALQLTVGSAFLRAPMDPSPVCGQGYINFQRLKAIKVTPRCSSGSLNATFKRTEPPFNGFTAYDLTLRNRGASACHADSVAGLRLLAASGRKLSTKVESQVNSPYVFPAHQLQTAIAMVATKRKHGSGKCDPVAAKVAVSFAPGIAATRTRVRPAVTACKSGLITLSALFLNG